MDGKQIEWRIAVDEPATSSAESPDRVTSDLIARRDTTRACCYFRWKLPKVQPDWF